LTKITSLTTEQKELKNKIRDDFINYALTSGHMCNKEVLQPIINRYYEKLGLKPPQILIADSYRAQKIMINQTLKKFDKTEDKQKFYEHGYGSYYFGWLSWAKFFQEIGVVKSQKLDDWITMNKESWNFVFFKNFVFCCNFPIKVLRDDNKRLHSTAHAAVQWRDGLNNYYIYGVSFNEELWSKVVKRKLPPKDILKLSNIEQRYIALELYGVVNCLKELNAVLIDRSKRGNELYEIPFDRVKIKLLKYACPSTQRIYGSPVKPEFMKADQAMAWKHNMTEEQYEKLRREV